MSAYNLGSLAKLVSPVKHSSRVASRWVARNCSANFWIMWHLVGMPSDSAIRPWTHLASTGVNALGSASKTDSTYPPHQYLLNPSNGDIGGTRKRCLGMARKLLTDARETS